VGTTGGEESEEETWTSESEEDSESEEEEEHNMSQSMTMTTTTTKVQPVFPGRTTTKFANKSQYDDMDIESLIDQLSAEEIESLTGHVDPDDAHIPPAMRCNYKCGKEDTGELNRDGLMDHITQQAINEPDREELVPYEPGKIRGKKWVAPKPIMINKDDDGEIGVTLDLECESALAGATEDEIVDLADLDALATATEEEIGDLEEFLSLL